MNREAQKQIMIKKTRHLYNFNDDKKTILPTGKVNETNADTSRFTKQAAENSEIHKIKNKLDLIDTDLLNLVTSYGPLIGKQNDKFKDIIHQIHKDNLI